MKFILINDFTQLIKHKYKYFISFFLVIIIFTYYQLILKNSSKTIFLSITGLEFLNNKVVSLILYLLNKLIILFAVYNMFVYDFRNSMDNLFLRISAKKWIMTKCFSIFLFISVFRMIVFLFIFIALKIAQSQPFDLLVLLSIYLKDTIYNIFLQSLLVLIIWLYQTHKGILSMLIVLISFFSKLMFPKLSFITNYWWLYLVFGIVIYFLLSMIYINNFSILFEKNGG